MSTFTNSGNRDSPLPRLSRHVRGPTPPRLHPLIFHLAKSTCLTKITHELAATSELMAWDKVCRRVYWQQRFETSGSDPGRLFPAILRTPHSLPAPCTVLRPGLLRAVPQAQYRMGLADIPPPRPHCIMGETTLAVTPRFIMPISRATHS